MRDLFKINYEKKFIRYMGGKEYAKKKLFSYVPPEIKVIASPFVGSGAFELYAAAKGIRVHAYDNLPALVRHWNIMLESAGEVIRMANKMFPVKQSILKDLIVSEKIHSTDAFPNGFPSPSHDIIFAALAMCMTRQGFNGYYMKTNYFRDIGDPVLDRFEPWDEDYWDNWGNSNISVDVLDWTETLKRHKTDFVFCDPPYLGLEHYYGQYETKETKYTQPPFDHERLAHELAQHENGAIITYQSDKEGVIKSLYRNNFEIIETRWHQGSRKSQGTDDATELIILKEPACRPSKRVGRDISKLGDPNAITRVYGDFYPKPEKDVSIDAILPETLCEWMEREFSCFNPEYPAWKSIDSILGLVPFRRYACNESDVRDIIDVLLERGIIEEHFGSHKDSIYYGYPNYRVNNMNDHIKEMAKRGIPVRAVPHFSYDYDETA